MNNDIKIITAITALGLMLLAVLSIFSAQMESDTYNRLTHAQTTWWDALWVELRVQGDTH